MAAGQFREDLFFRLSVFPIHLPPLRDRRDDIPALAEHFLRQARLADVADTRLAPALLDELRARPWAGNVRELRNAIEHAAIVARGRTLGPEHLPAAAVRARRAAAIRRDRSPATGSPTGPGGRSSIRPAAAGDGSLYERFLELVEPPVLRGRAGALPPQPRRRRRDARHPPRHAPPEAAEVRHRMSRLRRTQPLTTPLTRTRFMSRHAGLLPTYLQLRKIGMSLGHKLVRTLEKDVLEEGGMKLGILRNGVLVLDTEDQSSVLMDYCIHNVYRGGRNAVTRMLEDSPPSNPDELALLKAQTRAYYSIFRVEDVERGVGVTLLDLLRKDTFFMTDVSMGNTMREGFGLAGRVIPMDGYFMSGGAMLPFDAKSAKRFQRDLDRWLAAKHGLRPAQARGRGRAGRAGHPRRPRERDGRAHHVRGRPARTKRPGRWSPENPRRVRANRNDPCPCGSGRKYKSCCGKR